MEATVRRNQAELLEGGLHPEGLTVEEAALAGEPSSETPLGEAAGSAVRLSQVAELTLEARITQAAEPAADPRHAATEAPDEARPEASSSQPPPTGAL
ncbi:hypothetical protein QEG98_41230 [Myxococcus sp. MxC21-1]|uniref:hypothetical protein n=1 Tax=Myxococcus sp. MxC21-1 TaxID=3041439 RepID=UPI00292FEE16|nr:hypothetical protein [Myxococcus sp. MxC21-1]WNZ62163.1 hypothetical protein QEG98_41230 [Myxococcus sp. MxC21-1]